MSRIPTPIEAYERVLVELGGADPRVVVLDADLRHSTRSIRFAETFPDRFYEMGVAEANMLGVAAGLAYAGKMPFVNTFAVFAASKAFDQIRQSVAYPSLNVRIVGCGGGYSLGEAGPSHHAIEDVALMRSLPNMAVVVPADARETQAALFASLTYDGPMYLRLSRLGMELPDGAAPFALGELRRVRPGRDVAILALGPMVGLVLETLKALDGQGISAEVVNVHTVKPLDVRRLTELAQRIGAVVTVEDHSIIGGLGSAVAEVLAERCPVPLRRVGIPDRFAESAPTRDLMNRYGLSQTDIVAAVRDVIERKGRCA